MDFLNKFKLGFEWDDATQTELFIVDKKAAIKDRLEMVTVSLDTQRLSYLSDLSGGNRRPRPLQSNEATLFQVACVKKLDPPSKPSEESIEDKLKMHDPFYANLLRSYTKLLTPSFTKGEPVQAYVVTILKILPFLFLIISLPRTLVQFHVPISTISITALKAF